MDIAAQGGHLAFLQVAHLSLGVQHHDPDALDPVKTVRHGTARIARSSRQDDQIVVLFIQFAQRTAHEACAHVLEGKGRPVKEFQGVLVVPDVAKRHRKTVSALHDTAYLLRRQVLTEEKPGDVLGQVGKGAFRKFEHPVLVDGRDPLRHEKPPVGCQSHKSRLFERITSGMIARTVIFHLRSFSCPF